MDNFKKEILSNQGIHVSCDRKTCNVRLILQEGFGCYKEALQKDSAFFEEDIIEFAPCTSCLNGYICIVKGKKSIKDYLCDEKNVDLKIFCILIKHVGLLLDTCSRHGISIDEIVYDYRAVFLENNGSHVRFMYMPGLQKLQRSEKCVELIKVFFLHLYEVLSAEDYKKGEYIIEECLKTPSEPKIKNMLVQLEMIYLPQIQNNSWGKKLIKRAKKNKGAVGVKIHDTKKHEEEGCENKPCIEIIGEGRLDGVSINKIIRNKTEIIRIGRDERWSDIVVKDMLASRKHAELSFDNSGKVIVNDMSLNGTSVNGESLIKKGQKYDIDKDIRILITEECGILVKYKRAKEKNKEYHKEIV